jgi:MFS family permease
MTTDRKLWWATNFFIWSSVIAVVLVVIAHFIGHMAGGLIATGSAFILALINGLVLRRYKSRVAAVLFVLLGFIGFAIGMFLLLSGYIYVAVAPIVFFAAYVTIALWTFDALKRLHGERSRPVPRRSNKLETEKLETEKRNAYYLLIAKAVSRLPLNVPANRRRVYDRARATLAQHLSNTDLEREGRVLEEAINRFEKTAGGSEEGV